MTPKAEGRKGWGCALGLCLRGLLLDHRTHAVNFAAFFLIGLGTAVSTGRGFAKLTSCGPVQNVVDGQVLRQEALPGNLILKFEKPLPGFTPAGGC